MKCSRCRAENLAQAKFCEQCGTRLAPTCASCGAQLSATAKFCAECGAASTPPHLAEKILTGKAALEGERKHVTVLFADLKGSMELLADRDPEEARRLLDPVLERMMDAVHRYEGTVNQVMGDGIMALFGAPIAHEDHAVRACYAALAMQGSVTRYAEEARRTHGANAQIRVGLNSGEVVVRAIGSDLHMDYTAVGQTTHLAARMEQLATPGTILLTPATLNLAGGLVEATSRGRVTAKGLTEPVDVYELTGAAAVRSRLHAAAARGLTRLVGRETELTQLRETFDLAQAGHGQVVGLVGEPGVGKSRLFWEFAQSLGTQRALILESGGVSYGTAIVYQPVIDMLKAYFQIDRSEDTGKSREKIVGKVRALDDALRPDLPALLSLLDIPAEDAQWERLEPPQRRQRTLDGLKRLLLRETHVQPLVLLFEDLHWVDGETQALLESLVDSAPAARLMLVVTYRPEYRHGWGGKTYYRQLRIDPLSAERARDLLGDVLGTDAGLEPLKRALVERTDGNPLFLEESIRTLVETKVLVGERGAHRPADDARTIQVPPTVQAILAARIDRLSPDDKRLLQAASVVGKDVSSDLLQAIADLPEETLRQALSRLRAAELLYEARLFPSLDYTFKHALTHEVAYGSLLQEQRRTLHGRIARAIEQLHADRRNEHADRLAYHALRGEEWSRAARYSSVAGERAMAQARYPGAAAHFEAAIRASDREGEGADLSLKLNACLELWVARVEMGTDEGLANVAEMADTLARSLGDRQRLAEVRVRQAQASCLIWVGADGLETAITRALEAFDLAAPEDLRTRSYARFLTGAASLMLGRFADAVRELEAGVQLFEAREAEGEVDRLILPIRVSLRAWQGEAYAALGEFDSALAAADEAEHIARTIDHPQIRWLAAAYAGHVLLTKGEIDAAARRYESGLAVAEDSDLRFGVLATSLGLAHCHFLMGRRDEGLKLLPRDPTPGALLKQFIRTVGRYGALTAGAYVAADLCDEALAEIAHGLTLATAEKARAYQVPLYRVRAEALALQGVDHREEAGRCWRESLRVAADLGMRPELAHAHLGLGRLLRESAVLGPAREHLATATTMYREMDMRYWLDHAEAELKSLS